MIVFERAKTLENTRKIPIQSCYRLHALVAFHVYILLA
ncbi:uncharacterized protein METZ01_LOCUS177579 [marine metagenome]|uniref:Uncharacterized protein n=1 Tax=marine metagenome TaxID=408172 RepID=A0A382CF51_9ZZZZ